MSSIESELENFRNREIGAGSKTQTHDALYEIIIAAVGNRGGGFATTLEDLQSHFSQGVLHHAEGLRNCRVGQNSGISSKTPLTIDDGILSPSGEIPGCCRLCRAGLVEDPTNRTTTCRFFSENYLRKKNEGRIARNRIVYHGEVLRGFNIGEIDNYARLLNRDLGSGELITSDMIEPVVKGLMYDTRNCNLLKNLSIEGFRSDLPYDIEVWPLQAGGQYIHLIQEVRQGGLTHNSVVALSRAPRGKGTGDKIEADFKGLRLINSGITSLGDNKGLITRRFKVVNPIRDLLGLQMGGNTYGIYLTPELNGLSEINLDDEFVYGKSQIPFSFLDPKDGYIEMSASIMVKQLNKLLLNNALIYLLADKAFPVEFSMNAGDWMAAPTSQGLEELSLVTCRGGLERLSEASWISVMMEHQELMYTSGKNVFPFRYASWRPEQALEVAKSILNR